MPTVNFLFLINSMAAYDPMLPCSQSGKGYIADLINTCRTCLSQGRWIRGLASPSRTKPKHLTFAERGKPCCQGYIGFLPWSSALTIYLGILKMTCYKYYITKRQCTGVSAHRQLQQMSFNYKILEGLHICNVFPRISSLICMTQLEQKALQYQNAV